MGGQGRSSSSSPSVSSDERLRNQEANAPTIWEDCPGNISFTHEMGDKETTDKYFDEAKSIVKLRAIVNRSSPNSIETRGTVSTCDPVSGRSTVHAGVQGPFGVRKVLAETIFNESEDNFRVITGNMGGSFGMKQLYSETILTVWASKKLKRPVCLLYTSPSPRD